MPSQSPDLNTYVRFWPNVLHTTIIHRHNMLVCSYQGSYCPAMSANKPEIIRQHHCIFCFEMLPTWEWHCIIKLGQAVSASILQSLYLCFISTYSLLHCSTFHMWLACFYLKNEISIKILLHQYFHSFSALPLVYYRWLAYVLRRRFLCVTQIIQRTRWSPCWTGLTAASCPRARMASNPKRTPVSMINLEHQPLVFN